MAELLRQFGHTGVIDDARRWQQNVKWLDKLESHPSFIAAKERRRKRFYEFLEENAKIVEKMPEWMKGSNPKPNREKKIMYDSL